MKNDSSCQDAFEAFPVTDFWLRMAFSYPEISKILKKLLLFSSTWLCRSSFLTLLNVKTKQRNRLEIEQDIRYSLSSTEPKIKNLIANVQAARHILLIRNKWLATILSQMENGILQKCFQAPCFCSRDQCQACWDGLPQATWVKLNRLRTGVGRLHSSIHKWGLAPSPNCECGASEQTAHHVLTACLIHRAPHGARGLTVLDNETRCWLNNITASI